MKKVSFIVAMMLFALVANAQNVTENSYRGFVDAGYSTAISLTHTSFLVQGWASILCLPMKQTEWK